MEYMEKFSTNAIKDVAGEQRKIREQYEAQQKAKCSAAAENESQASEDKASIKPATGSGELQAAVKRAGRPSQAVRV